ncbi:MAG: hypothetical protein PVJ43_09820 [Gemmatimonadales bacterium]|jgi:hypothetical protein
MSWQEQQPRERARLVEAQLVHGADNRAQAEVVLEWRAVEYRGRASEVGHGTMDLRVCALASLDALQQLLGERARLRLVGVKSIKAFDDTVAIVAVSAHETATGEDRRLVGTAPAPEGDMPTGVARAVLNATNRLFGNILSVGD